MSTWTPSFARGPFTRFDRFARFARFAGPTVCALGLATACTRGPEPGPLPAAAAATAETAESAAPSAEKAAAATPADLTAARPTFLTPSTPLQKTPMRKRSARKISTSLNSIRWSSRPSFLIRPTPTDLAATRSK